LGAEKRQQIAEVRFVEHDSDAIVLVMHDIRPPAAYSWFSIWKTDFDLDQPSEKRAIAWYDDERAATAKVMNPAAYDLSTHRAQRGDQSCDDTLAAAVLHGRCLARLLLHTKNLLPPVTWFNK
jgi:hypothetical protein